MQHGALVAAIEDALVPFARGLRVARRLVGAGDAGDQPHGQLFAQQQHLFRAEQIEPERHAAQKGAHARRREGAQRRAQLFFGKIGRQNAVPGHGAGEPALRRAARKIAGKNISFHPAGGTVPAAFGGA